VQNRIIVIFAFYLSPPQLLHSLSLPKEQQDLKGGERQQLKKELEQNAKITEGTKEGYKENMSVLGIIKP